MMTIRGRHRVHGATSSESQEQPFDLAEHRASVIRRLLDRGISTNTLRALIPERAALIEQVAAVRTDEHTDPDATSSDTE